MIHYEVREIRCLTCGVLVQKTSTMSDVERLEHWETDDPCVHCMLEQETLERLN